MDTVMNTSQSKHFVDIQSNRQRPVYGDLFKKSEVSTWTHSFRQSAAAAFPVSFSGFSQRTEGCQAKLLAAVV